MDHKLAVSNREKLILVLFTLNGLIWAVFGGLRMIGLKVGLANTPGSGLIDVLILGLLLRNRTRLVTD